MDAKISVALVTSTSLHETSILHYNGTFQKRSLAFWIAWCNALGGEVEQFGGEVEPSGGEASPVSPPR